MNNWTIDNAEDLTSKIIIVTGANAGLGYETTLALAQKNATVIMACRNETKAEKAKQEILKSSGPASLIIIPLDLSSLKSVKNFAEVFLKKYDRLDVLINNAGIMIPPFSKTEDGFESQMAANYFGHFLLTGLLLDTLNATPNARIVMLSSMAHKTGKIDFDNLNAEKSYSKMGAYGQSKLACLMHAVELQRRLEKAGSKTIVVAAHPGVSNTELMRYIPKAVYYLALPLFSIITHSPDKGALPSLMAALSNDVQGGDYFGPTGFMEMKGKPGKVKGEPHAYDADVVEKLFDRAEELTNYKYDF